MNLESICVYCKKSKKCEMIAKLTSKLVMASDEFEIQADVVVKKCRHFKPSYAEKELGHICFSCKYSASCSLWDQVCNINEDFVKEAFNYDPEVQEVCTAVSRCKLYEPRNNWR
ncbi:MAG: hypothetical protein QXN68_05190 [Thermoplasmata archaeon]